MQMKEIYKKDLIMAQYVTNHHLARSMTLESFVHSCIRLDALLNNFKSLILCSLDGEKEIYFKIKTGIQNELEEFFKVHDELVNEEYDNKHKEKH